jgi:hypothetical protein
MQNQAARIFRPFDHDNSGPLSFDEFSSAIVMMNHDVPRKNNGHEWQRSDGRISSQYSIVSLIAETNIIEKKIAEMNIIEMEIINRNIRISYK